MIGGDSLSTRTFYITHLSLFYPFSSSNVSFDKDKILPVQKKHITVKIEFWSRPKVKVGVVENFSINLNLKTYHTALCFDLRKKQKCLSTFHSRVKKNIRNYIYI